MQGRIIAPSHTQIFLTSLYGSHKLMDPYDLATLMTDLRVVTSYYELFTAYYDVFMEKFRDLLRIVTDNYKQLMGILRVFYGLL